MKEGTPEFKSMGPLAFGPEGILFAADSKAAALFAIDTGDTTAASDAGELKVEAINEKIAALLGTGPEEVLINDMVVNPISRNVYLAISRGRGPDAIAVLVRVGSDGAPHVVSLDGIRFSRCEIPNAPADVETGEGRRRRNSRMQSITDIGFLDDRVLVAGLSNEEFASNLRSIPFPFGRVDEGTSVEIYHGAHGQFETRSPVRTFVPYSVEGEPHLVAAYTCTPLVQFPLEELKPGAKIRGKTIAELGNRNRPLDMIVYQQDGKDCLLLANSSRGIMKIDAEHLAGAEGIEDHVGGGGTKGVAYETIESWTGIDQLDRLDEMHALVVRKDESGSMDLETLPLP